MKVGILTFHLGQNHGGYLQAYCLRQYIAEMGHEVEFINYKNEGHHQSEIFKPWIYKRPLKLYHAWIKERVFRKAYKLLPKSSFTTNKAEVNWNQYDVIVVGSDVVWDYNMARLGNDSVYFGDFGTEYQGKLISYAASCGTVSLNQDTPEYVTKGLINFDHIGVRDTTAQQISERALGVKPPLVVDPTWLFVKPYKTIEKEAILVVYAYDVPAAYRDQIIVYAKKNKLKMIAVGYYHSWVDENDMKMSPLEWAAMMEKATAVVSGTFHGILYAIRCQTQFVVIHNKNIEYRAKRPLDLTSLQYRMLESPESLTEVMDQTIDYEKVFVDLDRAITESKDYLQSIFG